MLVKYSIKDVEGRGKGVIADEFISKGTKVWALDPTKALILRSQAELRSYLATQPAEKRRDILEHFYCCNGEAILLQDDTQYTNHEDDPSTSNTPDCSESFALRDIHPGQELTDDYRCFHNLDWFEQLCYEYDTVPAEKFPELLENSKSK